MGKLLSGHYGSEPEAESIPLTLKECCEKLNLKPTDFVSGGPPKFFDKAFGASGRYLLFLTDSGEVAGSPVWKGGYYLLPLEAKDVLSALSNRKAGSIDGRKPLPVEWEKESEASVEIKGKAMRWAQASQPLFFKCVCERLQLTLVAPWAMRRLWKARLRCPNRCQPPLTTLL